MTIEEIAKDIPFDINPLAAKERGETDLFAAFEKHLSVVAVKAETVGDEHLAALIDTVRKNLRGWLIDTYSPAGSTPSLSPDKKAEVDAAWETIKTQYIDRFSDDGLDAHDMLVGDIEVALEECGKILHTDFLKACQYARKLEKEYREKYGEPSGLMQEDFYLGHSDHWDAADDM